MIRVLVLGLVGGLLLVASGARADDKGVESLAWLAGCWAAEGGETGSGEFWMAPAGGTMFGVSRTVKGGVTVAHELMQIRVVDKKLTFIAAPSGQEQTAFALLKLGEAEVTFQNPKHDFPQRVSYRRLDKDRLLGRIEGVLEGKPKTIDFPIKRTACP